METLPPLHPIPPELCDCLPQKFTNPFNYTPHPLCQYAAQVVREYLEDKTEWREELAKGKMFGVLIVQDHTQRIYFLAAYSGNLCGSNTHPYFVPPVFNFLKPQGYFKTQEGYISQLNREIQELERGETYRSILKKAEDTEQLLTQEIEGMKRAYEEAKGERAKCRATTSDPETWAMLIKESQFQKAEIKRKQREVQKRVAEIQNELSPYRTEIEQLKSKRKQLSAKLQQWLFDEFKLLNANGEQRSLYDIFINTAIRIPPAGSGECAAPKLLQYAYRQQLQPIAMAEFWVGNSPTNEIRRDGYYYTACKGKCEPILGHMLQGLEVEHESTPPTPQQLEILYEDNHLVIVNKPTGLLSVAGKISSNSVQSLLESRYPIYMVHRLDMDTSGIVIVAKTKEAHKLLQQQFKQRTIQKRYIALLDGLCPNSKGVIELPLAPSILDRPKQLVDYEQGKKAITHYTVLEQREKQTRIALHPITGRTHQLRVHMAHKDGLNIPIVGDRLYGVKGSRLYLHAEYIQFRHPISGKVIEICCHAPF